MAHDPTLFLGTADYYERGRPPYSYALVDTLVAETGLDGTGRLLDVGCGPGILTTLLAPHFESAIGLDPDAAMLAAGTRRAARDAHNNISFVQAFAEDITTLGLGSFKLVTFGQSFHWTDRERVAEAVYDLLQPGGTLALIAHEVTGRDIPAGPGYPPIPHAQIRALIEHYLGPRRRAGAGYASLPVDRYTDALARTRFGVPRQIFCAGRRDIVQDRDTVLANYYSTSFAAPHLFGAQREQFEADVRALLNTSSATGLFWDWPGDTEIVFATKPD